MLFCFSPEGAKCKTIYADNGVELGKYDQKLSVVLKLIFKKPKKFKNSKQV